MNHQAISVLLVGNCPLLLRGMRSILEDQTTVSTAVECANAADAVAQCSAQPPDAVVLMFSSRSDMLQTCLLMRQQNSECGILAVCPATLRSAVNQIVAAGARGCVLECASPETLLQATIAVATGQRFIDPELQNGRVPDDVQSMASQNAQNLSAREEEVLRLIAMGYANKEIGATLRLSTKTIETYKTRSLEKLGLQGRAEIVQYAVTQHWLTDEAYRANMPSHDGVQLSGHAHDGHAHDGHAHDGHAHDGHAHDRHAHDGHLQGKN